MSRRDTIIVAVLVNAALLMILFATAIRKSGSETESEKKVQIAKVPPVETVTEEDLFNQYVTAVPTLAQEEPLSFTEDIELSFTPPKPVEERKPQEVSKPASNYVDVTVKKGDYLEKIANANNTTVAAIMEANKLSSTQLKIGQVLKVPLSKAKPKSTTSSTPTSEEVYYIVKEGDNPWLIASRNHIRLDELLKINGLDEQKARRLQPGDRLRIK